MERSKFRNFLITFFLGYLQQPSRDECVVWSAMQQHIRHWFHNIPPVYLQTRFVDILIRFVQVCFNNIGIKLEIVLSQFRSMVAQYKGLSFYKAIPTLHYTSTLGDMTNNPEEQCFCRKPNICMKKGVMDLTNCQGFKINNTKEASQLKISRSTSGSVAAAFLRRWRGISKRRAGTKTRREQT